MSQEKNPFQHPFRPLEDLIKVSNQHPYSFHPMLKAAIASVACSLILKGKNLHVLSHRIPFSVAWVLLDTTMNLTDPHLFLQTPRRNQLHLCLEMVMIELWYVLPLFEGNINSWNWTDFMFGWIIHMSRNAFRKSRLLLELRTSHLWIKHPGLTCGTGTSAIYLKEFQSSF